MHLMLASVHLTALLSAIASGISHVAEFPWITAMTNPAEFPWIV